MHILFMQVVILFFTCLFLRVPLWINVRVFGCVPAYPENRPLAHPGNNTGRNEQKYRKPN